MKKKYIIRLLAEERQRLTDLVRKGKVAAYRRTHAQILLFTDGLKPSLFYRWQKESFENGAAAFEKTEPIFSLNQVPTR